MSALWRQRNCRAYDGAYRMRRPVWGADHGQPIEYEQDKNGLPLRETRDTLETEYRCGNCAQTVDVNCDEDEEGLP